MGKKTRKSKILKDLKDSKDWKNKFCKDYLSSPCSPKSVKAGNTKYCYPSKDLQKVISKYPECNSDPNCLHKKQSNDKDLEELNQYIKPNMPKDWNLDKDASINEQDIWLSNWDLDDIMHQFEESHSNFKYIHALPIDFGKVKATGECIDRTMCKFNVKDYWPKKDMFGFIFNLDESTMPGSHWICSLMDLRNTKKPMFYFYCSYASAPPREIRALYERMKKQLSEINMGKLTLVRNKKRHQYGNTECGMFCIHLLYQLINNNSFNKVCSSNISDDTMLEYRTKFFNSY